MLKKIVNQENMKTWFEGLEFLKPYFKKYYKGCTIIFYTPRGVKITLYSKQMSVEQARKEWNEFQEQNKIDCPECKKPFRPDLLLNHLYDEHYFNYFRKKERDKTE